MCGVVVGEIGGVAAAAGVVVFGGGGRGGRRRGEARRSGEVCVRRTLAASLSPAPHTHTHTLPHSPPANPHVNITILFFQQNHECGLTYISDVTEDRVSG